MTCREREQLTKRTPTDQIVVNNAGFVLFFWLSKQSQNDRKIVIFCKNIQKMTNEVVK
jgi:hypothetical protein